MNFFLYGFCQLTWIGYVLTTLVLTQMTIMSVTLYLHRSQAHRSVDFHPVLNHIFRFWLWLTTSQLTNQWIAVHRCHHAKCETKDDPHSPKYHGAWAMVMGKGLDLYARSASNSDLVKQYAHGAPNDWIEQKLYQPYQYWGVLYVVPIINFLTMGLMGLVVWGVQMLWIPFHAAGIINGLGHYLGYRNYHTKDLSTNLLPWGFWIGGEELHNNHHAFPESCKFNHKAHEFDIGYTIICVLSFFRLATIRRVPPPELSESVITNAKTSIQRWKLLIANRLRLFDRFSTQVIQPVLRDQKDNLRDKLGLYRFNWMARAMSKSRLVLEGKDYQVLIDRIAQSELLVKVRRAYDDLQEICHNTKQGHVAMMESLKKWCASARDSNINVLIKYAEWVEQSFIRSDAQNSGMTC